jgi:LPS-assembly protein
MIAPVPAPEIAFGQQVTGMAQLPDDIRITHNGPEGNLKEEALKLRGPVHLKGDNGLEIFSDVVFWDGKGKKLTFEGNVSIYQGNMLQRGDRTVYFYETKQLDTSGMRASADPILLESGRFRVETINGKQVYIGKDAGITTNDQEDPDYWIRASETRIYPDDKVVFRNLKLYAGDTPVFWLPYLSQPLHSELGYHFIPGARSNWGPYLLNSYGIMLGGDDDGNDPWLFSKWHFDFMGRRGIGTGVELRDPKNLKDDNLTGFSFYYLNDLNPDISRSGVERGFVNEDRYQIELKQRFNFDMPDDATWYADANLTFLSDVYYLEDFDPQRYRSDPFPDNTLGLYRRDEKSLLSLYSRFQLNDFYRSDTRLPEIAFDQARGPLFDSPILHEGSTSFSILGDKTSDMRRHSVIEPLLNLPIGDPSEGRYLGQLTGYELILAERIRAYQASGDFAKADALREQLVDSGFTRLHTFHDFSLPMNLGGWLSLVPHAGIGYTRYDSVDGPADSFDRMIYHLGAEASVKFSKDHSDYKNEKWGLDGLLHVIQPYANWSVLSTDEFDETQPRIDRLTFTTRPRPLSPSRYTAIDDFHDWNTIRLGARNRLITKRDGQSYEWLFLDTYMDAFMEDEENGGSFSNLYNDIRWQPLPWLTFNVETQFPIFDGGSGFTEFATSLTFQPHRDFQFTLGYRALDNHPVLIDSNRIDLTTFTRFSEGWGFGTRHTLELDDNTLEVQQYTVHRDLGNWVAGVGITHRDNRLKDEFGIMFSLTLRDLPSATLPFTLDAE